MKRFKILVEGPDCSGKSTLIDRLKNNLRWDAKSLHHREGDQFERYLKEYSSADRIIFDRGHFSEIVYSTLWRGGNPFSSEEESVLASICNLRFLTIFCCSELEDMKKRYEQRAYAQQIKLEELNRSRQLFLDVLHTPHLTYHSSNQEELEQLIRVVGEIVQ